jgi:hypothetical protein
VGSGLGRGVVTRVLVGVGSEGALVFSGDIWVPKATVEVGLGARAGWGVGRSVAEANGCHCQGCITPKQTRMMIKTGKIKISGLRLRGLAVDSSGAKRFSFPASVTQDEIAYKTG